MFATHWGIWIPLPWCVFLVPWSWLAALAGVVLALGLYHFLMPAEWRRGLVICVNADVNSSIQPGGVLVDPDGLYRKILSFRLFRDRRYKQNKMEIQLSKPIWFPGARAKIAAWRWGEKS